MPGQPSPSSFTVSKVLPVQCPEQRGWGGRLCGGHRLPWARGKLYPHGVSDLKLDFHLDGASGCCGEPCHSLG